jgi:hypothetical protein
MPLTSDKYRAIHVCDIDLCDCLRKGIPAGIEVRQQGVSISDPIREFLITVSKWLFAVRG